MTSSLTNFGQRRELARRLIHQNGVTHNVYGDPNGLDRPWSLDFIPLLIAGGSMGRHLAKD